MQPAVDGEQQHESGMEPMVKPVVPHIRRERKPEADSGNPSSEVRRVVDLPAVWVRPGNVNVPCEKHREIGEWIFEARKARVADLAAN